MQLTLKRVRSLRFRLLKINPNLLRRCNFYRFNNLTYRGFYNLTHKGFKRRRRDKVCGIGCNTKMLSTKPKPVLSEGDF